jgi:hypothetical protein
MSALDCFQPVSKKAGRRTIAYAAGSLLLFVFQIIYHHFSHGVTSSLLACAWLIPPAGYIFLALWQKVWGLAGRLAANLYHSGIATLCTWAVVKGILDIALTSSPYTVCYLIAGIGFLAAGLAADVLQHKKSAL